MSKVLSVAIAAYNVQDYLEECLDSLLLDEIISDLEVLVVDDGSKDLTSNIAKKYEQEYPNTVYHIRKENGGWGSTLNVAMQKATGKYFKQLDGDDNFLSDNLRRFINDLKSVDADIVFTEYEVFEHKSGKVKELKKIDTLGEHGIIKTFNDFPEKLPEDYTINMHTMAVKTKILQNEKVHITENCFYTDVEFVLKSINIAETYICFQYPIYRYRLYRGGQSVSIEGKRKHYKDHIKALTVALEYVEKQGRDEVKELLQHRIRNMTRLQYNFFLILEPSSEAKNEIRAFDKYLKKKYPAYYNCCGRKIKLLRISNYIPYKLVINSHIKKFSRVYKDSY